MDEAVASKAQTGLIRRTLSISGKDGRVVIAAMDRGSFTDKPLPGPDDGPATVRKAAAGLAVDLTGAVGFLSAEARGVDMPFKVESMPGGR